MRRLSLALIGLDLAPFHSALAFSLFSGLWFSLSACEGKTHQTIEGENMNQKPNLNTTRDFLSEYLDQPLIIPGWPQYSATRAVLIRMARVLYRRHWDRELYVAYAQAATPSQVELNNDQSLKLCRELKI